VFALDAVSMAKTQLCHMYDRNAYHNNIPDVCVTSLNNIITNHPAYQSVEVKLHEMVAVFVLIRCVHICEIYRAYTKEWCVFKSE
jgi:hypothetical protein